MPSSLPILVHILSKQCTLSGIFDCGREHATFSASFVTFIYDTALPASKISSESITILLRSSSVPASSELDSVRPQSAGEEQLHLQLAIAISKEEHDREERRRRAEEAKEEAKVQMALEQSRREDQELLEQQRVPVSTSADGVNTFSAGQTQPGEGLFSLVDTSLSAAPAHVPDPWSSPLADSLTTLGATSTSPSVIPIDDPWTNGAVGSPSKPAVSPPISTSAWGLNPGSVPLTPKSAVDLASNGAHSSPNEANGTADNDSNKDGGTPNRRHTPADFLGEHQRLVDLEKLVEKNPASTNPFAVGLRPIGGGPSANPFLANQPAKLSLNQLAPPLAPSSSNLSPSHPPLRGLQTIQSPFNVAPANYFVSMHGNPWSASNPVLPQNQASMNPFY
ncbi:unnamed protein product [Dicrocoelium dendriticum]|nr:unnamed protein product [Dicrocoelium dendriticum]